MMFCNHNIVHKNVFLFNLILLNVKAVLNLWVGHPQQLWHLLYGLPLTSPWSQSAWSHSPYLQPCYFCELHPVRIFNLFLGFDLNQPDLT